MSVVHHQTQIRLFERTRRMVVILAAVPASLLVVGLLVPPSRPVDVIAVATLGIWLIVGSFWPKALLHHTTPYGRVTDRGGATSKISGRQLEQASEEVSFAPAFDWVPRLMPARQWTSNHKSDLSELELRN